MSLTTKLRTRTLPRYLGNSGIENAALVDLATNENRLGPSPLALAAYERASADLLRYPDSAHRGLKAALAQRFGVAAERIACGAGSDELISLLVRLFAGPGDEVLFPQYSFVMFGRYAMRVGAIPVEAATSGYRLRVDSLLEAIGERTAIVFLANPNNPTGSYLPAAELTRLASGVPPHIPLVVDGAYFNYVDDAGYSCGRDLLDAFPNLVLLRSFSKLYGLAALRIGWCFAPPSLIDDIDRLRGPYNLSAPAQAAAIGALADIDHEAACRRHNNLWRARLTQTLAGLGLQVEPSGGNFLTVVLSGPDEAARAHRSLNAQGLLARPLPDYAMPQCLRITIGNDEDNERIVRAFQDFVA